MFNACPGSFIPALGEQKFCIRGPDLYTEWIDAELVPPPAVRCFVGTFGLLADHQHRRAGATDDRGQTASPELVHKGKALGHRGLPVLLVQPVLGRCHQQGWPRGQRSNEQCGPSCICSCICMRYCGWQQPASLFGQHSRRRHVRNYRQLGQRLQPNCPAGVPIGPRDREPTQRTSSHVVRMPFDLVSELHHPLPIQRLPRQPVRRRDPPNDRSRRRPQPPPMRNPVLTPQRKSRHRRPKCIQPSPNSPHHQVRLIQRDLTLTGPSHLNTHPGTTRNHRQLVIPGQRQPKRIKPRPKIRTGSRHPNPNRPGCA